MKKLIRWLQKMWCRLFGERYTYYAGADVGFHDNSIIVIRRDRCTGLLEVIHDHYMKDKDFSQVCNEILRLCRIYNISRSSIAIDLPSNMTHEFERFVWNKLPKEQSCQQKDGKE